MTGLPTRLQYLQAQFSALVPASDPIGLEFKAEIVTELNDALGISPPDPLAAVRAVEAGYE